MFLIKNANLLTMEEKNYEKGDILIKDNKILKIDETIDIDENEVIIIDATGKIVTPGLIDAHCHLGMWEDSIEFEGADGNEMTDPVTPQLRAIDGINPMDRTFEEAYQNGVTSVATGPGSANVIGGQFVAMKTVGKRIDTMIIKDPIAMKCAFGENPKRVYNDQHKMPMTRMATAAILRELLMETREYLEQKEEGLKDADKKPEMDFQLESLIPVMKKEIPLKAHAHRADDIFTAIRIAKEFDVNITIDHCTDGHLIAEELKEANVPIIVGPSFGERSKFELKNMTFETPKVLSEAGIKFALMTDHPVIPIQYLPMCAALSVKAGLKIEEALKAITIYPAEILGLDEQIGSLKEGKDADLVIWDAHPLDLQSRVEMTMVNGKIAYQKID